MPNALKTIDHHPHYLLFLHGNETILPRYEELHELYIGIFYFYTVIVAYNNLYIKINQSVHTFSIYYCICDGGDANRQFINIHFSNCSPIDLHFIGYNMFTEDPMVFLMDCKAC